MYVYVSVHMLLVSVGVPSMVWGGALAAGAELARASRKPLPPPVDGALPDSNPKIVEAYAALNPRARMTPYSFDLPSTIPPPGYVDVEISHCGLCHSDIHQIDDAWGVACFPLIPGHEIVGTISAVGAEVNGFAVGDRAAIGVQRGCCCDCSSCDAGLENVCAKITKTYAGPGKDKGGFAKMIRYPASWVFSPPASLAPEVVAPLMCAGITTYSPLKRFIESGVTSKVGIVGIGGLGHVALQFAKAMLPKGEVVALSRTEAKEDEARGFGATSFLVTEEAEAMSSAAGSFDLLLNTVSGHPSTLDAYLSLLKPRGTLVNVGLPSKEKTSNLYLQSVVPSERMIAGSYLGPYRDYDDMLLFAAQNGVQPQVEVVDVAEINEAITKVRNNEARYRMVLRMGESIEVEGAAT